MTAELFAPEMKEALRAYEKYIVCLDKTPDQFALTLLRLVEKAIKEFEQRSPGLKHGIALDRQVTVIISERDAERPLCGIYFNLHSPYLKKTRSRAARPPA